MKLAVLVLGCMVVLSCQKKFDAPVPDVNNWEPFYSQNALPLTRTTFQAIEGVYDLTEAADFFGAQVLSQVMRLPIRIQPGMSLF